MDVETAARRLADTWSQRDVEAIAALTATGTLGSTRAIPSGLCRADLAAADAGGQRRQFPQL
jgi:hypothetical protein